MMDYQLGQTLLIAPHTSFRQIRERLLQLGFRLEQPPSQTPLLADEPEFASFTWQGRKPFVLYTFNPVARLRVLDVATVPPPLRGAIAGALPLLDDDTLKELLFSKEPRERLLGLWSLQETERLDLLPQATRLRHDPVSVVAEQAQRIEQRLRQILEAREHLLMNLRLLVDAAEPLIRQLNDPLLIPGLKPTAAELAELFDPELAPHLQPAVDELYRTPPLAAPGDQFPHLSITAANAGLLRWPNELSDKFPRGYRNIAGWMTPRYVWFSWRWTQHADGPPGAPGVQFDGLVWLERRWVWIPKAFRLLAPILDRLSVDTREPGAMVH